MAKTVSSIGTLITTAGTAKESVALVFAPLNADHANDQTNDHAARVAQINRGGGQVIDQESRQRSGQHQCHHADMRVSRGRGDDGHHDGRRDAHDRGQPVQTIQQINGIDAAHEPEHGERHAKPPQREGIAEDDHAIEMIARQHDGHDREELQQEFKQRVQVAAVVDAAHQAHQATGQNDGGRKLIEVRGAACPAAHDEQSDHECQIDGHAAPQRDRLVVAFARHHPACRAHPTSRQANGPAARGSRTPRPRRPRPAGRHR